MVSCFDDEFYDHVHVFAIEVYWVFMHDGHDGCFGSACGISVLGSVLLFRLSFISSLLTCIITSFLLLVLRSESRLQAISYRYTASTSSTS